MNQILPSLETQQQQAEQLRELLRSDSWLNVLVPMMKQRREYLIGQLINGQAGPESMRLAGQLFELTHLADWPSKKLEALDANLTRIKEGMKHVRRE